MCPKCKRHNGWDVREYPDRYPQCVYCGYEDYSKPFKRKRYLSKGLKYSAPYVGKWKALEDKEAIVEIVASKRHNKSGGVDYLIDCPMCGIRMRQAKNRQFRFTCNKMHTIKLASTNDGTLKWI